MGNEPNAGAVDKLKSNKPETTGKLSETAEFVHEIATNYIYPELRADIPEVAKDEATPENNNITTDTDELDRTS